MSIWNNDDTLQHVTCTTRHWSVLIREIYRMAPSRQHTHRRTVKIVWVNGIATLITQQGFTHSNYRQQGVIRSEYYKSSLYRLFESTTSHPLDNADRTLYVCFHSIGKMKHSHYKPIGSEVRDLGVITTALKSIGKELMNSSLVSIMSLMNRHHKTRIQTERILAAGSNLVSLNLQHDIDIPSIDHTY